MNLFIGWSKAQSKVVATALHGWLRTVVPGIEPWMSEIDIAKGREWFQDLEGILDDARCCIICITRENIRSPWLYYEAGAIAAKGSEVLICPYLVGVSPNMLADGPLGGRQSTTADREDTWALIKSLNTHVLGSRHDELLLKANFRDRWPAFAAQIQLLLEVEADDQDFVTTDVDLLAGVNLSDEARTIILAVSKDRLGDLQYFKVDGGTIFRANGLSLCPDQAPRTVARWKAAVDVLVDYKILEPRRIGGDVFALTAKGYDIADALQGD